MLTFCFSTDPVVLAIFALLLAGWVTTVLEIIDLVDWMVKAVVTASKPPPSLFQASKKKRTKMKRVFSFRSRPPLSVRPEFHSKLPVRSTASPLPLLTTQRRKGRKTTVTVVILPPPPVPGPDTSPSSPPSVHPTNHRPHFSCWRCE